MIKLDIQHLNVNVGPSGRKSDFVVCEQQRFRPACAYAQSDQNLCYSLSILATLSACKTSRLYLVSVAEQVGLSLTWSQTREDGFSLITVHISSSYL